MSSTYGFQPLPEDKIRLFAIHPATSPDDPLECSVYIHSRCSSQEYEAVSYVWAATDQDTYWPLKVRSSEEVQSNGTKNFFIRPNLAAALKRMLPASY